MIRRYQKYLERRFDHMVLWWYKLSYRESTDVLLKTVLINAGINILRIFENKSFKKGVLQLNVEILTYLVKEDNVKQITLGKKHLATY